MTEKPEVSAYREQVREELGLAPETVIDLDGGRTSSLSDHRGEVAVVRGHPIDRIEVVGKHLLVLVDRRWTLHVHLGLKGRWRLYDGSGPSPAAAAGPASA